MKAARLIGLSFVVLLFGAAVLVAHRPAAATSQAPAATRQDATMATRLGFGRLSKAQQLLVIRTELSNARTEQQLAERAGDKARVAALQEQISDLEATEEGRPIPMKHTGPLLAATAVDGGPITAPATVPDMGIRLAVPSATPALTVSKAETLCGCLGDAPQQIELAVFSDDQYTTNGVPNYQNVLAYVMIWSNAGCFSTMTPPQNWRSGCQTLGFINANTGAYLLWVQH